MNHGLLVGAGFLLGTVGVKVLKSEPVRNATVKTIAQGLRIKEEAETIVDEAKAEFDDILAEAGYEKDKEDEEAKELPAPKKAAAKTAATKEKK